jgi:hypothetical protein
MEQMSNWMRPAALERTLVMASNTGNGFSALLCPMPEVSLDLND